VALRPSPVAYTALVGAVALERLFELYRAERNRRRALARGGIESGEGHYPSMVALHAGFLVACPLEVWLLGRPFVPALALAMLGLLALSMALRYWAIATLGERWCTRIVVVPGEAAIVSGPYRFLRHPNYLAVVIEIVALPLVHTAYLTAVVASALNAWLLAVRIGAEERALREHAAYDERVASRRFLPGGSA
jgi:methyltransferase